MQTVSLQSDLKHLASHFQASLIILKMQIRTIRNHFHLSDGQRSKGLITPYLHEGIGGRHSCLVSGHAKQYTLFQGQAGDILNSNLQVPFDPAAPP